MHADLESSWLRHAALRQSRTALKRNCCRLLQLQLNWAVVVIGIVVVMTDQPRLHRLPAVQCGTNTASRSEASSKAVQTNPFPRNWLAFLVEAVKKSKRLFSAFLWSVGEPLGHPQILRHCRSNGRVPRKLHVDTRSVIVCVNGKTFSRYRYHGKMTEL